MIRLRHSLRDPRALPGVPTGVPGLLPTVASRATSCEKLDPSVGQRRGIRTTRLGLPQRSPLVVRRRSRPSHPASTFVTTRTPLARRDGWERTHFSEKRKRFIFAHPLERTDHIGAVREIRVFAHRNRGTSWPTDVRLTPNSSEKADVARGRRRATRPSAHHAGRAGIVN
jgi:hypothetical protein